MKKFLISFILFGFLAFPLKTYADQQPIPLGYQGCYTGYKYNMGGGFYNDVKTPQVTGKSIHLYEEKNVFGKIVAVSNAAKNNKVSIDTLKRGQSSRTNYMFVVEVGNAGILEAAKNGGLNKIHFIEMTKERLYVPLIFIPVYFDRFITTVYGE